MALQPHLASVAAAGPAVQLLADGKDPLDRMLRILRFWFSRDTKWKTNQLRKPYNPVLGEQFVCEWKVPLKNLESLGSPKQASQATLSTAESTAQLPTEQDACTVRCITEQISHHPPISAFKYFTADERVVATGLDHVIAKFTGTSFKVGPGEHNDGIYITLKEHNEVYNITHPWATVHGWITGSPYIVVTDQTVVLCPETGLKAILEYKEESFFGRPKFAVVGKIFKYNYEKDRHLTDKQRKDGEKLNKIPDADVLCTITGAWNGKITYRLSGSKEDVLLFDMNASEIMPKIVRPLEQ
eukprot:jgi/Hompol1/5321/HPOL_000765-RA